MNERSNPNAMQDYLLYLTVPHSCAGVFRADCRYVAPQCVGDDYINLTTPLEEVDKIVSQIETIPQLRSKRDYRN